MGRQRREYSAFPGTGCSFRPTLGVTRLPTTATKESSLPAKIWFPKSLSLKKKCPCQMWYQLSLPVQSEQGSPACAYIVTLPHSDTGMYCLLLWMMTGSQHILSGSFLVLQLGFGLSGWSGSAPAIWWGLASSACGKRHKIEMFLCFAPKTIHTYKILAGF